MKYDINIICLNCGKATRIPLAEFIERHGDEVKHSISTSFKAVTFMRNCSCTKGVPAAEHKITQIIQIEETKLNGYRIKGLIEEAGS